MTREITNKNIEGIADLVVIAPIREGFIDAFENVTYETRLRIVAEALHNIRVSAREHETITPYSDSTERILSLLDFRIGILDRDLFQLVAKQQPEIARDEKPDTKFELKSRRYLYLTATFDEALEPYMRLIWRPLGYFLDLLFCNCEGYKPAGDTGFPDYIQWVRSVQMDSAIFYSTTGLTVRDQIYMRRFERVQREGDGPGIDLTLARMTMPDPEAAAADTRRRYPGRANALALEALTVLYRLADYYPPDRINPLPKPALPLGTYCYAEGRYLLRAAQSLLLGWNSKMLLPVLRQTYAEQLAWYENDAHPEWLWSQQKKIVDPVLAKPEVQAGILSPFGADTTQVRSGALLLMSITDAEQARKFIAALNISHEGEPPTDGLYTTIGLTMNGLKRLGAFSYKWRTLPQVLQDVIPECDVYPFRRDQFPKEFREGMEKRAGLIGDYRENHPRNWILPDRNWPPLPSGARPRPPVEMSEVDFVIQLRLVSAPSGDGSPQTPDEIMRRDAADRATLDAAIAALANAAAESGVELAAVEPMVRQLGSDSAGNPVDHFGFRDGISQPLPQEGLGDTDPSKRDVVRLGEILCGYHNDLGDYAPRAAPYRGDLQFNGSYMVIRKIAQDVATFEAFLIDESARIARDHGINFTAEDLASRLMGRYRNGTPLVAPTPGTDNDFDYRDDAQGDRCPFASHVRRTNPRTKVQGRPTPRLMRRGMSFGPPFTVDPKAPRGLMFMAFNANISEQFEAVQRWVNGGNSTNVPAAQNDPLLGISPAEGDRVFRFIVDGKVIRSRLPKAFVKLHWGLYLFMPSRTALADICSLLGSVPDFDEAREMTGRRIIRHIENLPRDVGAVEWKRLLEDFDAKDPAEQGRTPDVWSAIRYYWHGSYRLAAKSEVAADEPNPPPFVDREHGITLVASARHIDQVLSDPARFSVTEQATRLDKSCGPIYIAMQPALPGQPAGPYEKQAAATNDIMWRVEELEGFNIGYRCATAVLQQAVKLAESLHTDSFKIELRRNFLMPTLGAMCSYWFGLPDKLFMENAGWSWDDALSPRKARCPGDFLSPSRDAFYPQPGEAITAYAKDHGARIHQAAADFVAAHRKTGQWPGTLTAAMATAIPPADDAVLAQNIIGMMIGALPPVDGNLRGILYEWLSEKTLWTNQAALLRETRGAATTYDAAKAALRGPITRAMCKRPAPDLIFRTATEPYDLQADGEDRSFDIHGKAGDLVIIGLVSASQRSLQKEATPDGDVTYIFGGTRVAALQPPGEPTHACPAQKMMMGSMTGILAALLDVGRIQAMPSSLIVRISDWRPGYAA